MDNFSRRRRLGDAGRVAACKACEKVASAAYYQKNRTVVRARLNAARQAEPEKYREIERASRSRHPETVRRGAEARRNREQKAKTADNADYIRHARVFDRDGGVCYLCCTTVTIDNSTIDHVIPLSRGGEHTYENVRISCVSCNLRKNCRLVEELNPTEWPRLSLPLVAVGRPPDPEYVDLHPIAGEEWKSLLAWSGRYEVSSHGRVRSYENQCYDGLRLLKPKITKTGYVQYALPRVSGVGSRTQYFGVHRLVLVAFIGDPPTPQHIARHKNHDRSDNRVENLEWGTHQDNMNDLRVSGRAARGVKAHKAVIDNDIVKRVAELLRTGLGSTAVSRATGISHSTVASIKYGKSWGWLTGASPGNPIG